MSAADIDETDIRAVAEVLRSGRLALGPKVEEFEHDIAAYVGVKYAVAVSSGTAALHLIVKTLGIGPGDEVLVPSFTFAASVNAILYEHATPVFVDIEPDTYNLDPIDVERKITHRTKAIVAVDVFGHPADWDAILAVAAKHGLTVIDDSCEALGAEYKGRKLGQFGNASAFGFYPNKQITTGEGGIIVTDDEELAAVARSLRNQGRTAMGPFLEFERLGFNYRLDELSAALGVSQLKRVETFLRARETVARMYTERLGAREWVRPPATRPYVRMSWFVYVATLAEGLNNKPVIEAMEAAGVPVRGYFSPIHQQPYLQEKLGTKKGLLPVTESVCDRTIALPFHNRLSEREIDRVVQTLTSVVTHI
jgi:perosamine synthetase